MSADVVKISLEAQIEALANQKALALLKSHGIDALDIKPFFSVSRADLVAYLHAHPSLARGYLLAALAQRPQHDHIVVEKRGAGFVVYDMDHGKPSGELFYVDLYEAVADYLAFGYGYEFKKGSNEQ